MAAHQNGGEFRLTPVLLRGDEEIRAWDDPVSGDKVFALRTPEPPKEEADRRASQDMERCKAEAENKTDLLNTNL